MHLRLRDHSRRKFFFSTFSAQIHLLGAMAMTLGALPLLNLASRLGNLHYWASFSFLLTGIVLFLVSSTYHFLSDGFEASDQFHVFFENLDHFCIYLFIAGTYSPFLLNGVSAAWKMPLLFAIWASAIAGILYTFFKPRLPPLFQHRFFYTTIFLAMGCTLLLRAPEVYRRLSSASLTWLSLGCLSYAVGAVVYATRFPVLKRDVFGYHELWHLLVLMGALSHYAMVYSFYSLATA